jgi:hypothetical protein
VEDANDNDENESYGSDNFWGIGCWGWRRPWCIKWRWWKSFAKQEKNRFKPSGWMW